VPWIRDFLVTEVTTASTNPQAQVEYPEHQTNDVLLLMLAVDAVNIPALPSGYTDIQNQAGTAQAYRLCFKVAASNAEVCPALSLAAGDEWHIGVIAVANADAADVVNVTAERTATDAAAPFTWASGASTDETNTLVLQFINSDSGLALTCVTPGYTNLINGDCGTAGFGCAYTFQPASGSILDATWKGRANDDTTACLVAINDDGNGTRPSYADPISTGSYIRPLGGATLIESDTAPASLTYGAIGMQDFDRMWSDNAGAFTDETTDINDVGTADVTITNTTNNAWYFGYTYKFNHMVLQVSTAQVAGTIVWEYWNGSTWTTLTVAGVLTATGWVRLTWTTPSAWATTAVNSDTKYYVRMRISATFTTAPVLSRGHVGGWVATYDAIAAASDAGINPYMDAISLSPAATSNFSGSEHQFGAAVDLDTGVLLLHHKSVLPRDYAVDVAKNDVVYPVTEIGLDNKSGTLSGYGGFLIVLGDANSNYEAYAIHSKQSKVYDPAGWNVAAIGLNNGAYPYGTIGALSKSAVTRMLLLPQGAFGAMLAHVSSMAMIQNIVFAGGDSTNPMDVSDIRFVANNTIGTTLALLGTGDFNRVYAPIQFGGGGQIKTYVDGAIFQFPTKYDGKEYLDYNGNDNVLGVTFYGTGANDELKFPNCVWKGSQPFRWEFHASHSGSAVLDYTGNTVQGATVVLRATSDLDGVRFVLCPTFTQNGAALINCIFTNTKVDSSSPANAALISDSLFVKSTGTRHGLEITGTAADFTLDGVTFTGFAGTNGSTGNEAIYVNIASGTMTISITGGGSIPSIRTAGAVVTVINAVTVKVTAKDADSGANIQGARVLLYATTGATVTISRSGSTATVSHTTHGYLNGQKVQISGANEGQYNGVFTISNVSANAYDYTVSGTPGTPATGTITSRRVVLDADTDAGGIVQTTTFSYVSDLAVSGRVRKGSASTYYKTSPLSGTILSTGLDVSAFMVKDG
jgi:hypothetical protein